MKECMHGEDGKGQRAEGTEGGTDEGTEGKMEGQEQRVVEPEGGEGRGSEVREGCRDAGMQGRPLWLEGRIKVEMEGRWVGGWTGCGGREEMVVETWVPIDSGTEKGGAGG